MATDGAKSMRKAALIMESQMHVRFDSMATPASKFVT